MDFALSSEQETMRREIIRFARESLNADVIERDRDQVFSRDLWQACARMGLTGLPVSAEHGGTGLDALSTALALEALGYGCHDSGLVFSVCAHVLSCVVPLAKFGNEAQRQKYLTGLCDGTLIGVHAMSEPGSGSDAFALRTRAEARGDEFMISGTKTFVSNGPVADVVIVFALTDPAKRFHGGVTAFLVERGMPGVSSSRKIEKMGLRTSPFCELSFDSVRVGCDAVLGGVGGGARVFTHAMDWERVCLFASHLGTMERLLEQAIAYARTRTQFSQPIGKNQAVAHKIADAKVQLEAARLLTYRSATRLETSRTASLDAAMTKLCVSEALVRSALDTVQIFGGYGYSTEYEVERALRDAIGSTIYSGTSEMQRNIIARWLGL
jgi:alkylation response protein AidB-like acyl-CoA dehydrogenase